MDRLKTKLSYGNERVCLAASNRLIIVKQYKRRSLARSAIIIERLKLILFLLFLFKYVGLRKNFLTSKRAEKVRKEALLELFMDLNTDMLAVL